MRGRLLQQKILTAATANGVGASILVADQRNLVIALTVTTAPTTGTFKIVGSVNDPLQDTSVGGGLTTFGSASSKINQWGYLSFYRMDTGALVSGATGLDLSTLGGQTLLLRVNTDGLTWVNNELSAITGSGEVTSNVSAYCENGI